jgi:hypothetical protein
VQVGLKIESFAESFILMSPKEPKKFSASQVATFDLCERKWFYGSVLGKRYPQSDSAALGERVHGRLENYLRGEEPDWTGYEGAIAVSGIEHLPEPGSCIAIEKKDCDITFPGGYVYNLRSDFVYIDYREPHRVVVGDHKTLADFKYAHDEESLRKDFQAGLYGYYWSMREDLPASALWIYYQTGKSKTRRSRAIRVDFDESDWTRIEAHAIDRASRMTTHRRLPMVDASAYEIKGNRDACGAFGGCPYEGICGIHQEIPGLIMPGETLKPLEIVTNMNEIPSKEDLLAQLHAQPGANAPEINAPEGDGGAPVAEGGTPAAVRPTKPLVTSDDLFAELEGRAGSSGEVLEEEPAIKAVAPAPPPSSTRPVEPARPEVAQQKSPPPNAVAAYQRDVHLGVCIWAMAEGMVQGEAIKASVADAYRSLADRAWVAMAERELDKLSGRKPQASTPRKPREEKARDTIVASKDLAGGYEGLQSGRRDVEHSGFRASGEIRITIDISDRLAAFLERLVK